MVSSVTFTKLEDGREQRDKQRAEQRRPGGGQDHAALPELPGRIRGRRGVFRRRHGILSVQLMGEVGLVGAWPTFLWQWTQETDSPAGDCIATMSWTNDP